MFGARALGKVSPDFHGPTARAEPEEPARLVVAGAFTVSVRLAAGGIEFRQGRGETLPRGFALLRIGCGSNRLLDERSVAHVEELARLIQLESRLADIPVGAKLDVGPWRGACPARRGVAGRNSGRRS